jgi:high-affinity Fe2+/Pb2+ permease
MKKKIVLGLFLSGVLFWGVQQEVLQTWVSENPYWSSGIVVVAVAVFFLYGLNWGSQAERERRNKKDAQEFMDRIRGQQGHMTTGRFRVRGHFR